MILFTDMIADMVSNKKLILIVTEIFVRGKKLNIFLVFITQSYFAFPNNIRLNSTHYFVIKNSKQTTNLTNCIYHSSDTDFQDYMNLYKKCIAIPYLFSLLILLLHQIILHFSERFFQKGY